MHSSFQTGKNYCSYFITVKFTALSSRFGTIQQCHRWQQPEERWGEDALVATWAAKWERELRTAHSTCETMLLVCCRCISAGRQLPARGALTHNSFALRCHKLFEPLLGFIQCPGLCMEAARTTTAPGPAITVSGMEWFSQVPGIFKFIYLFIFLLYLSIVVSLWYVYRPKWHYFCNRKNPQVSFNFVWKVKWVNLKCVQNKGHEGKGRVLRFSGRMCLSVVAALTTLQN